MGVADERQIVFTLRARARGEDVTPRTISLAQFNRFNREVEHFVAGSSHRTLADEVRVTVDDGSYRLILALSLAAAALIEPDLRKLERQDGLLNMDPRRAAIVREWQQRARKNPAYRVEIAVPGTAVRPVIVSNETDFHTPDQDEWSAVELYIRGTVKDLGGSTRANVHLQLDNGATMIAESTPEYLRDQRENFVYQRVQVRIAAERNIRTGQLRHERLVEFVGRAASYDQAELDRFVEAGTSAWADVPDAVAWVREQRGRNDE